jgi:hypothetical protein
MHHKRSFLMHRLRKFFVTGFATYGVLWTIVESVSACFSQIKPHGLLGYALLVIPSVAVGAWRAWPVSKVELAVPNSDSVICIEFGDIWEKTGCIAIQVNEYFDSLLGDHVSPNSIHGQFIRDVLRGQSADFDTYVSRALSDEPFETVPRPSGNPKRYRIGTTASIDIGPKRYLLFAFAKTDINTLKASATIHELWDALAGLWCSVTIRSNGEPVYMPLIGSGLSGVGLPAKNLIQILMTSFSYYTKKQKITGRLTIVLPKSLSKEIDLRELSI